MVTDAVEVRPCFNPIAEYLRAVAPFILPGAAALIFYTRKEILGIERHLIFSGWQRFFPVFILAVTAFFVLPAYLVFLRKRDCFKTRYYITPREADAYISQYGRLSHLLFTVGSETRVEVKRSLLQRFVSTGDVILRDRNTMLRIRDIKAYEDVSVILKKGADKPLPGYC